MGKINETLWYHQLWEKQISDYYLKLKPEFPENFWEAYSASPEPTTTTTTTFRPWDEKSGEPREIHLHRKTDALTKLTGKMYREKEIAKELENKKPLPDFY
jgi:hypothetical protein